MGFLEAPLLPKYSHPKGMHAQATMYAARLMIPDVMAMKLFGSFGSGIGGCTQFTYLVFLATKALHVAPSNLIHGILNIVSLTCNYVNSGGNRHIPVSPRFAAVS